MNLSEKIGFGMAKTRAGLGSRLAFLFRSRKSEQEFYSELEEILITSDVGLPASTMIVQSFRQLASSQALTGGDVLQESFARFLEGLLSQVKAPVIEDEGLTVLMLLGVNGSGKTTTAGKLAKAYTEAGRSVLLAAADTFRAAASEQLAEWAERTEVPIIRQKPGADPGAVVFDALDAVKARKYNTLLVDTAGRFHNRDNLVRELQKIDKIVRSKLTDQDRYLKLIVLDATAGSNAYTQAKSFHESVPLDGVILTKMDSSARGGVVIPLVIDLGLPVYRLGVGEGVDDLVPFDEHLYVQSLFA